MPFELGKLARGLTGALGLRAQGLTPQSLADQVVQVVPSLELFLLDTRERTATGTQTTPAVGLNSFATPMLVPAGELWYVWNYACIVATGVGEAIDIAPACLFDGVAIGVPVGEYRAAAASQEVRTFNSAPFWAGPGSELCFCVRSLTATPDVNAAAVVTKLRI